MIETGKPFKMKPKTRKARNALRRAADILEISSDELLWVCPYPEMIGGGQALIIAIGDSYMESIRWVQTQDDPDWEIV